VGSIPTAPTKIINIYAGSVLYGDELCWMVESL